MFDVIELVGAL